MNFSDRIHLNRHYDAIPEVVFDAWIKPEIMRQWLFANGNNELIDIIVDARKGGRFRILELNQGQQIDHYGVYIEVQRPLRLAFTLEVPWHFKGVTIVTISVFPEEGGSHLIFTQTGIDREITEDSWNQMLDRLGGVLGKTKI